VQVTEPDYVVPLTDPDAEGIAPERRRVVQERRLRALVDRLLSANGLQAERLRAAGVTAGAGVELADLATLPMVTKADLWQHYPTGLRAVDDDQIVCIHGSSGTGGRPTLVPYTVQDLDVWAQVMARALGGAGATRRSIVHNAYGYGLFTGGLGVHHGAIRLGATVLPISGGMTDRQVTLIADLKPDILTCTPSYAVHLGEAMRTAKVEPTSLRAGIFGAEPWTDSLRGQIERLLGIRALDIYGLSEIIGPGVACESLDSGGLLNVAEDHFYVEAVDATGAPVPDGTPGELVFSTLTKTGMPLLRYRTGDVAALADPLPGAPRTLRRMTKILGRVSTCTPPRSRPCCWPTPGSARTTSWSRTAGRPTGRSCASPWSTRTATATGTCCAGTWSTPCANGSRWAVWCGCCRPAACRAPRPARPGGSPGGPVASRRSPALTNRRRPPGAHR
jgi:phenylacetate-CoA ligase